jgi:hypothetical protein
MRMFGFMDLVLAGILGLGILVMIVAAIPKIIWYMNIPKGKRYGSAEDRGGVEGKDSDGGGREKAA